MKRKPSTYRACRNPSGYGRIGTGGFKNATDAATKLLAKYGKAALGYARDYYTVASRDADKKFWTVVYGFIYDEVAGVQTNPRVGNSGWEFKQRSYTKMLCDALEAAGQSPSAEQVHDLIEASFRHAKAMIQQADGRIIPVSQYPALRAEVALSLAKLTMDGALRRPGPHLRGNPRGRNPRNPFWIIPGTQQIVFAHTKPHPKAVRVSRYLGGRPRKNHPRGVKVGR
jgi:hypothetical protein